MNSQRISLQLMAYYLRFKEKSSDPNAKAMTLVLMLRGSLKYSCCSIELLKPYGLPFEVALILSTILCNREMLPRARTQEAIIRKGMQR